LGVRGVFDSRDLQRRYLGLDDLFVGESYMWATIAGGIVDVAGPTAALDALTSGTPCSAVPAAGTAPASIARDSGEGAGQGGISWLPRHDGGIPRRVTALRTVRVSHPAAKHLRRVETLATRAIAALRDSDVGVAPTLVASLARIEDNPTVDLLR